MTGVVARVADQTLSRELLEELASVDGRTVDDALRLWTEDAILAAEAERRGLNASAAVQQRRRAVLARAVTSSIHRAASGPATDAELEAGARKYWRTLDRPPQVKVIHAVVRRPPGDAGVREIEDAKRTAEEIRAAVMGARTRDEFREKAGAIPSRGARVVVEELLSFAQDGRVIEGDGSYDKGFAEAAFRLGRVGDTSEPIETSFGWHIIRLLDRIPASQAGQDERRATLTPEIHAHRTRRELDAILARRRSSVSIDPAADTILSEAMRRLHDNP